MFFLENFWVFIKTNLSQKFPFFSKKKHSEINLKISQFLKLKDFQVVFFLKTIEFENSKYFHFISAIFMIIFQLFETQKCP